MAEVSKYMQVRIDNLTKIFGVVKDNLTSIMGLAIPVVAEGGIDEFTKLMLHMDGDQSDSSHEVTTSGDPQLNATTKKFGASSMYFDGAGDYLAIPDHADWNFGTGAFTFDFWVNFSSFKDINILVNAWDIDTVQRSFYVRYNNSASQLQFELTSTGAGGDLTVFKSWSPSTGTWYHIAVVRNSNTFTLYVGGVSIGSEVDSLSHYDSTSEVRIGKPWFSSPDYYFDGYMDELRITKGEARWTSDFTPPTSAYTSDANTKLLLHFDGDESDSGHTVTFNDGPQITASGTFDGSYHFNGTTDYLTSPDSADWNFGTGDFTIDMWVYHTTAIGAVENYVVYYHHQIDGIDAGFITRRSASGGVGTYISTDGTTFAYAEITTETVSSDVWHHIAIVRTGDTIKQFIDGILATVDSSSYTGSISTSPDELFIGCEPSYSGGQNYINLIDGYIDELRISKGVARWTENFTPPTGPYTL